MVQSQWTLAVYKNTKKTTIEVMRLRIFKIKELIVKGIETKLKILIKEDI